MCPGGRLNRPESRNNMVYVSYEVYLIKLLFTFIVLHHFHMCPSPFFSMFSLPRHDRDGYGFYHHCMISTWIGELLDLNLADEWPFRSACWHFDNVFLLRLGTFRKKLSPAHPHISVSIWEHLAQNHTMFSIKSYCQFVPMMMTGDTAWKWLWIIKMVI